MKKIIAVVISLVLMVIPCSLWAGAADLSDGVYEVPVVLMHKEDEKESFGNKYIAQAALLKVEGDSKTVTILLTTDMKGIAFSYYKNGSLEGDVAECAAVSDVTVAGEVYKQGFEIPVMTEGDIGLQFSVPVMPMSPSARLRIDYEKAVPVSSQAEEQTTTKAPETTTAAQTTTEVTAAPVTTTEVTVPQTTAAPATEPTTAYAETTTAPATQAVQASAEEEGGVPSFVFVVILLVAAAALMFLLMGDSKEEKNHDDK